MGRLDPAFSRQTKPPALAGGRSPFIVGGTAFLPDPDAFPEVSVTDPNYARRNEIAEVVLGDLGLKVVTLKGVSFAGGNVILDETSGTIFWGEGIKALTKQQQDSVLLAIERYEKKRYRMIMRPNSKKYFHLDLAMSEPLPGKDILLVDPCWAGANKTVAALTKFNWFRGGSMRSRNLDGPEKKAGGRRLEMFDRRAHVLLPDERAECVTNFSAVGTTLFMTTCPDPLRERLTANGYTVNAPNYADEPLPNGGYGTFHRYVGDRGDCGGVHCLTLVIG